MNKNQAPQPTSLVSAVIQITVWRIVITAVLTLLVAYSSLMDYTGNIRASLLHVVIFSLSLIIALLIARPSILLDPAKLTDISVYTGLTLGVLSLIWVAFVYLSLGPGISRTIGSNIIPSAEIPLREWARPIIDAALGYLLTKYLLVKRLA